MTKNYKQVIWGCFVTENQQYYKVFQMGVNYVGEDQKMQTAQNLERRLSLVSLDDGQLKSQEEWSNFGNDNGIVNAAFRDYINEAINGSPATIRNVRKDAIVASDRLMFNESNPLMGRIVNYFGSKFREPISSDEIIIPIFNATLLPEAAQTEEGLLFLEVFTGLKGKDKIFSGFSALSELSLDKIFLYTSSLDSRKRNPNRPIKFCYCGSFLVGDYGWAGEVGRSYGLLPVLQS